MSTKHRSGLVIVTTKRPLKFTTDFTQGEGRDVEWSGGGRTKIDDETVVDHWEVSDTAP